MSYIRGDIFKKLSWGADNLSFQWLLCLSFGVLAYEKHVYDDLYVVFSGFFVICLSFLVLLFYRLDFVRHADFCENKIDYKLGLFLVLIWLYQCTSSIYHGDTVNIIRNLLFLPIIFLYLRSVIFKIIVFNCFIILAVICAFVSLGIQFGFFDFWEPVFLRNASIFFDPNYAGVIFGLALIFCLTIFREGAYLVAAPILFLALILSYSRGAFLALVISLIAYACGRPALRNIKLRGLITALLGMAVPIWWVVDYKLMVMRLDHGSSGRLLMWVASFKDVFMEGHFFGSGADGPHNLLVRHGLGNSSTHNFFIDNMVVYGVPSLLMWFMLVMFSVFQSWRHRDSTFPALLFMFIISNFLVVSVGGIGLLSFFYSLLVMHNLFPANTREGLIKPISESAFPAQST